MQASSSPIPGIRIWSIKKFSNQMQRGKLNFTMYVSPFGVTLENFDKMECLDATVLAGTARLQNEGRYYGPPDQDAVF